MVITIAAIGYVLRIIAGTKSYASSTHNFLVAQGSFAFFVIALVSDLENAKVANEKMTSFWPSAEKLLARRTVYFIYFLLKES